MAEYSGIWGMSSSIPKGTDQLSQADDHMRGIKVALQNTLPAVSAPITASDVELNRLVGFTGADTIEERFNDIEGWKANISKEELETLDGISTTTDTIQTRLVDVETKLINVGKEHVDGLIGYIYSHGKIEDRLAENYNSIEAITGGAGPAITLNYLHTAVLKLFGWQSQRENDGARLDQLAATRTYNGAPLPAGYYKNNLGADMVLMADKIAYLEYVTGMGTNTGYVTWRNYFYGLFGGQGGINITNTLNTKDTMGFIIKGLDPGTTIDFLFWVDADLAWGPLMSSVNPNKIIMVSNTGEAFVSLNLGNSNDKLGVNTGTPQRLPESGSGKLQVQGTTPAPPGGNPGNIFQTVNVAFYKDKQVVAPTP